MINITVGDIEKVTEGKLIYGERDIICENFCRDSREIESGDTYIGIKGERVDGNTFYEEALKKGATCLILENVNIPNEVLKKYSHFAIIIVENTIEALQKILQPLIFHRLRKLQKKLI